MKLIVLLGNPGLRYRRTRHNVGFLMGDAYAKQQGLKWKNLPKFDALAVETADKTMLVKPQKFYNLTGEVVQNLIKFYKLNAKQDLLVICDDLNLDFGTIRIRKLGSDGGNNGLKSIIATTGLDFARIRIGTKNSLKTKQNDRDFVLGKFSNTEQKQLPIIYTRVSLLIDDFIAGSLKPDTL
ncbi:aminoacyl-tRNA hydrolase [Candidatus Saccharibacteria bacterium]|nr:aminoacyl-tRNA hydrolase [Candidatus Saccharibacteria bacterium]